MLGIGAAIIAVIGVGIYFVFLGNPGGGSQEKSFTPQNSSDNQNYNAPVNTPENRPREAAQAQTPPQSAPPAVPPAVENKTTIAEENIKTYRTDYYEVRVPSNLQSAGIGTSRVDYKFAFEISNETFIATQGNSVRTITVEVFEAKQPLTLADFERQYKNYLASGIFLNELNPESTDLTLSGTNARQLKLSNSAVDTATTRYYFVINRSGLGILLSANYPITEEAAFAPALQKILASFQLR